MAKRRRPAARRVVLLNKPYRVLCQFGAHEGKETLKSFVPLPDVYPAGRLDYDSEGLVVLTNDGALQARLSDPKHKLEKVYWVQVEGEISEAQLQALCDGVRLNDGLTLPARARRIAAPKLWERTPPVRFRKTIPTSWLEIELREGRNRQVRRMTAAVGLPTLRLVRVRVGDFELADLPPGAWREVSVD